MLVINLLGGPGCGKSSTAFGLVYRLKSLGINANFVPEYAKEIVYAGDTAGLQDQEHILRVQHGRLELRRGKVDIAVVDSALINALVYSPDTVPASLRTAALHAWSLFDNVSFLVERSPRLPYEQAGRAHTREEALAVDGRVRRLLEVEDIPCTTVAPENAVEDIQQLLVDRELLRPGIVAAGPGRADHDAELAAEREAEIAEMRAGHRGGSRRALDMAEAELRALPPCYRSIKSAPQDGSDILIHCYWEPLTVVGRFKDGDWVVTWDEQPLSLGFEATHWTYLPGDPRNLQRRQPSTKQD